MDDYGEAILPAEGKSLSMIVGIIAIVVIFSALLFMPAKCNRPEAKSSGTDNVLLGNAQEKTQEYQISISTDRQSYSERDRVELTINITVPEKMDLADIRFFGIKNKLGDYKTKRDIVMNLTEGLNVIETETNTPSCSKCSGIEPGTFQIYAALYKDDAQIINASTDIEIVK